VYNLRAMHPSFFREMPKFRTPEEELDYLRAHVRKREEELVTLGHFENAKDNAVQDVVGAYKNIPIEEVIHKNSILEKRHSSGSETRAT